jgi:hypothetical protein
VEALGQATFEAAWKRGEAMTFDDAVACALATLDCLAAPAGRR